MARFIARRLALAVGTLFVLSFLMYGLLEFALDPLVDLRENPAPNRQELIDNRIRLLNLDVPWYQRYFLWLGNFLTGDFGIAWRTMQPVATLVRGAIATSVQLVFAATIISILLGVTIGLVSALRQYTSFDYAITFVSFLLYSLPIFWVAVLLKQFLAIGANDYLQSPTVNWPLVVILSIVSGLFWAGALGGKRAKRIQVFVGAFVVTLAVFAGALLTGWVNNPTIGIVGIGVLSVALALGVSALFAGMNNKRALYAALTTAVLGTVLWWPLQWLFFYVEMNWLWIIGLLALSLALAALIGWLFGGPDRQISIRGAMITALFTSVLIFVDRVLQTWVPYNNAPQIRGRPLATIGASTPGLNADFWMAQLDRATHIMLPTLALVLISFATYVRYQRGAMLEVLNQDYIRTARAKGLSERVVIVRHALRNALMPLASIVPVDFITLIGGAVITETIFGWAGMGRLFITSMDGQEVDPVMFYIILTGGLAMIANLVADFLYAVIDPRIRVNA
ncbi:ABC transporter permease [Propioniciclava soli]|uniref:ABC transporter permease subunit n=1 Tax=Propioniciclava soli TaxID=2775081 RepID=A0ABZ3C4L0_9ACTN|nr:ABC transporter permease [Propioniciclava soli]